MMEPWDRRRPDRYRRELVAGRCLTLCLMRGAGGEVVWQGNVQVNGRGHYLHIQYPPDFPNRPPLVVETEPFKTTVVNDSATTHQLLNGALCLYTVGNGPRSWQPDYTVSDVVARYKEFREMADAGQHRNEHGDDLTDLVGMRSPWTVVVPPALAEALTLPGAHGMLRFRRGYGAALVVEAVWPEGRNDPIETTVRAWLSPQLESMPPITGSWHRAPPGSWRIQEPELRRLSTLGRKAGLQATPLQLFVRHPGGPEDMLAVFVPRSLLNDKPLVASSPVRVVDLSTALFERVDGAMSDRAKLAEATAVFVGLGSLGASIALHLARSGVGRFHLFDPELLEPENVCRHAVDLEGLYLPKVLSVARAIRRRNPGAEVKAFPASPLWDGPPHVAAELEKLLGRPSTLLVVTTADDQVERSLNEQAILHGTPALYASVLGEAEHGRVFRVLPGRTPCYQCILDSQVEAPEKYPFVQAENGGAEPRRAAYRQTGIAGVGIDVEQVAVVAARTALQTLGAPLGIGYPEAWGDHLLIGLRGDWIFDHPQQVCRQRYPRRADCPVCSSRAQDVGCETATLEKELSAPERIWEGVTKLSQG